MIIAWDGILLHKGAFVLIACDRNSSKPSVNDCYMKGLYTQYCPNECKDLNNLQVWLSYCKEIWLSEQCHIVILPFFLIVNRYRMKGSQMCFINMFKVTLVISIPNGKTQNDKYQSVTLGTNPQPLTSKNKSGLVKSLEIICTFQCLLDQIFNKMQLLASSWLRQCHQLKYDVYCEL